MNRTGIGVAGVGPSLLALGLAAAGFTAAVGEVWPVAEKAADGMGMPDVVAAWPLWLALAMIIGAARVQLWARLTIALAGMGAAGALAAVAVQELVPSPSMTDLFRVGPGVAGALLLALWATCEAIRHRRQLRRADPVRPAGQPRASLAAVAREGGDPASPTTPVSAGSLTRTARRSPEGQWRTVTTPWPRAIEDDPDGTVLRPPRRRAGRHAS